MKMQSSSTGSKLLYVLADGARARFVEHREVPPRFATIDEMDARDELQRLRRELRSSPRARNQQSGSPGLQHTIGREAPIREAKEAFASAVAERAKSLVQDGGYEGVVVAAPDRLLASLSGRLEEARITTAAINRDLTKTPDSALGAWLEVAPEAMRGS
jgi:protein required for attachment to host cells